MRFIRTGQRGGELVGFTGVEQRARQRFEAHGAQIRPFQRGEADVRGDVAHARIGQHVLRRGVQMKTWFAPGASTGALLLHELGHVVGLQHVADIHQIMYPVFGSYSSGVYQAGDLTGLGRVGRHAGCMSTAALPPVNPLQWSPTPLAVIP